MDPADVGLDLVVDGELVVVDHLEHLMQSSIDLALSHIIALTSILIDLIHICSEDEHIIFADLFGNFNIGAIHGTDDDGTIHNEFHVGGT